MEVFHHTLFFFFPLEYFILHPAKETLKSLQPVLAVEHPHTTH